MVNDVITTDRSYTTRTSAHGSGYVKECEPEQFNKTRAEAEHEVKRWRIYADTVGGDAIICRKLPIGLVLVNV